MAVHGVRPGARGPAHHLRGRAHRAVAPIVANSDAFLDPDAVPAHAQVFLDQIPQLRAVPVISTWPEIEDTANGLIEEAYYGGGRALEVAVELATQTRDQFARAET